jgi:hypothetical protein
VKAVTWGDKVQEKQMEENEKTEGKGKKPRQKAKY